MVKRITLPLTDNTLADLKAGDNVLLNGVIYVGRDAAHKIMVEALDQGKCLLQRFGSKEKNRAL